MGVPSGFVARLIGPQEGTRWRDVRKGPGSGFFCRWRGMERMMVEGQVSITPAKPGCAQDWNPGVFPLGIPQGSVPAYVHWMPSVIYHGLHGAITGRDGMVYTELLDCPLEELDLSQARERGLTFTGKVMALSCSKNYFHWLLKMLPRLDLVERAEGSLEGIEVFLINKPTWQQEEVYKRLDIWDRCVVMDRKSYAACRMLVAPSLAHDGPGWACQYVRRKLGVEEGVGEAGRMTYVRRGKTAHRVLVNEEEVCALLRGYGFEVVHCSGLSVEEQARVFARSGVIVGVHGAAFSNLVFCNPGTVVLEIFGTPMNQKLYWLMSHRMGLRYHYLMAAGAGDDKAGNMADITVDLEMLGQSVEGILRKGAGGMAGSGN